MKTLRVLKDVFLSSLPLAAIILIVCVFVAPLQNPAEYMKLLVGYVSVVVGQSVFLVGLDESILPIGKLVGKSLVKFKKAIFVILFGVLFGLLATVAEPALTVLARQTHMIMEGINETLFVWVLSAGIGVFVGLALWRIMKDVNIKIVFIVLYILIFAVVIFVPNEFVALAFDGSGATTGDVSVPFILALGMGVSITMSKRKTNDDTFGILGIASAGAILALFIYGIILKASYGGTLPPEGVYNPGAVQSFGEAILSNLGGVALALFPVVIVFLPLQFFVIKLPRKEFLKMLLGTIPVYFGLVIFLSGIDFGFAFAGKYIGGVFLDPSRPEWFKWLLLGIAFILGVSITLSEPAVTVLGEQLEEITNGHIKKMTIRLTLAIGIGFAALMAMVKILTQIDILWFLVPLYGIALIMMFFTSDLFVGLAFDSGGVSGGALTSAFLTPLTLGTAQAVAAAAGSQAQSILVNGFGIIAFISVTPLISVQMLGIIYNAKLKKVKKSMSEELDDLKEFASEIGAETAPKASRKNRRRAAKKNGKAKQTQSKTRSQAATVPENGSRQTAHTKSPPAQPGHTPEPASGAEEENPPVSRNAGNAKEPAATPGVSSGGILRGAEKNVQEAGENNAARAKGPLAGGEGKAKGKTGQSENNGFNVQSTINPSLTQGQSPQTGHKENNGFNAQNTKGPALPQGQNPQTGHKENNGFNARYTKDPPQNERAPSQAEKANGSEKDASEKSQTAAEEPILSPEEKIIE